MENKAKKKQKKLKETSLSKNGRRSGEKESGDGVGLRELMVFLTGEQGGAKREQRKKGKESKRGLKQPNGVEQHKRVGSNKGESAGWV